ncbi:hypothetical protein D3C78_829470 [compost metagenome]
MGVVQGFGHAVDTGSQLIHLITAHDRQAFFQVAVLELGHGVLYLADGVVDRATHAQGQQRGGSQATEDQQQAGEQAAIAAQ